MSREPVTILVYLIALLVVVYVLFRIVLPALG